MRTLFLILIFYSAAAQTNRRLHHSFDNERCLDFDGINEYVYIASASNIGFLDTVFSVSGWFKTAFGGTGTRHMIIARSDNTVPFSWQIELESANTLFAGYITTAGLTIRGARTAATYADLAWHNFVVTFNTKSASKDVEIYVDGAFVVENNAGTGAGTYAPGSTPTLIGAANGDVPALFWDGTIDDIAIWTKQLSAGEVTELYNSGTPSDLRFHSASDYLQLYYYNGDCDYYPMNRDHCINCIPGLLPGTMTNMDGTNIILR